MKKYSKLLSLITAVMLFVSSVGFAADIDFDRIIENTNREYDEYIAKALKEAENNGIEADEDKISILLWQEPANIDDSIEPDQVFVFVPEKTSDDVYGYAYYENGKPAGAAKNFDFGGHLGDVYSLDAKKLLEKVDNPEEITHLLISGRLSFIGYYIDAEEDYVWIYDIMKDSKYNEMEDEKYEIELETLYEEEEFIKIIKAEEKAYKEYLKEKEDKEVVYKDKDGDEKVKKPKKDRDDDDEDEICTCKDCPDRECAKDPEDCDCDLEECTSEDCREDAFERSKDKKEDRKDKVEDCDCDKETCENEECREDALEEKREKEKKEKKEKRQKKIKEVNDYGVFQGDEEGNLHEEEYITRAEFAVVVCKILGLSPEGVSDEFDFEDVDDKHWAKEYIKTARKAGIISGRGGNKYDPDAKISYEEAMKILVAAMGYTPKAEQKGGYPYGYNKVAQELGVDKDLFFEGKKEAIRGDVMEMVYNSLDVPLLVQKVFGDSAEYEVADGTNGKEITIRIIIESKPEN